MLLEDVACSVEKLGEMSMDLVHIFKKYGYHDACLMGHALEGNLHLIFNQVTARALCIPRLCPSALRPAFWTQEPADCPLLVCGE